MDNNVSEIFKIGKWDETQMWILHYLQPPMEMKAAAGKQIG